jgi:hypothetical protein
MAVVTGGVKSGGVGQSTTGVGGAWGRAEQTAHTELRNAH